MQFNFSHLKMASKIPLFRNKKIFLVFPLGLDFGEVLKPLVKVGAVRASSIMKHSEGKVQVDPLLIEPSTQLYFGSYTDLLNVSETITPLASSIMKHSEGKVQVDPLLIEPSTQLYFGSYTDLLNVSETITFTAIGVLAVTETEFRKAVNEADVYAQLAGYSRASVLAMTASEYAGITARLLQQVREVFSCPVELVLSPKLVKNKKEKDLFSGPGWMSIFYKSFNTFYYG